MVTGYSQDFDDDHECILVYCVSPPQVTPAGKADKSGVKPNDILVSINGTSTLSIPHIDAQQLVKSAGKALKLELIR